MWYREPPPMSAFDEEIEEYLIIERERDFLLALVLYGEDKEDKKNDDKEDKENGDEENRD
jgi:hypothetical protein